MNEKSAVVIPKYREPPAKIRGNVPFMVNHAHAAFIEIIGGSQAGILFIPAKATSSPEVP